jgi:GNAT superfamily N-acetyltransferase
VPSATRHPQTTPAARGSGAVSQAEPAQPSGGGWTARSALARTVEVAREEGPRALWFKVLGELFYRRLVVFELRLESDPPQPQPRIPIAVTPLGDADITDYSALHPTSDSREIACRLAAGHRCWLVRSGHELVASSWVARGRLWSAYLARWVPLAPGEACTYETFTAPTVRGLGIGPALRGRLARDLRDIGYRRLLATVGPENAPAIRLVEKLGYRRIGTIGYAGLGAWRRGFHRTYRGALAPGTATAEDWQ